MSLLALLCIAGWVAAGCATLVWWSEHEHKHSPYWFVVGVVVYFFAPIAFFSLL